MHGVLPTMRHPRADEPLGGPPNAPPAAGRHAPSANQRTVGGTARGTQPTRASNPTPRERPRRSPARRGNPRDTQGPTDHAMRPAPATDLARTATTSGGRRTPAGHTMRRQTDRWGTAPRVRPTTATNPPPPERPRRSPAGDGPCPGGPGEPTRHPGPTTPEQPRRPAGRGDCSPAVGAEQGFNVPTVPPGCSSRPAPTPSPAPVARERPAQGRKPASESPGPPRAPRHPEGTVPRRRRSRCRPAGPARATPPPGNSKPRRPPRAEAPTRRHADARKGGAPAGVPVRALPAGAPPGIRTAGPARPQRA